MKKKYVLGILTAVVLMFGITACEKTEEPAPEQSATPGRTERGSGQ